MGAVAALSVGLVWLVFTLTLKTPRTQQWMILGFISPIFFVPLFYQLMAWFDGSRNPKLDLRSLGIVDRSLFGGSHSVDRTKDAQQDAPSNGG